MWFYILYYSIVRNLIRKLPKISTLVLSTLRVNSYLKLSDTRDNYSAYVCGCRRPETKNSPFITWLVEKLILMLKVLLRSRARGFDHHCPRATTSSPPRTYYILLLFSSFLSSTVLPVRHTHIRLQTRTFILTHTHADTHGVFFGGRRRSPFRPTAARRLARPFRYRLYMGGLNYSINGPTSKGRGHDGTACACAKINNI